MSLEAACLKRMAVMMKPMQLPRLRFRLKSPNLFSGYLHIWSFLSAIVLCGTLFGGVIAGELKPDATATLGQAVLRLLQAVMAHQLAPATTIWWQRMVGDGQVLALLWLFGVTLIGFPLVIMTLFLRAFSVGFAVGFTVLQFGWKGFLIASTAIFLHQIVSLSAMVLAGSLAMRFSLRLFQNGIALPSMALDFVKYTLWFAAPVGLLMVGAFIQSNVAPHILESLFVSPQH